MRTKRWTSTVAGLAVVAVAGGFVAATLAARWEEARAALTGAHGGWLALSLVAAAGGMLWIAWTWRTAAEVVGADMTAADSLRWYLVGELGKYVPGVVWPVVGRAELARRGGASRAAAYGSVVLSLLAVYLANAAFVVVVAAEAFALVALPAGLAGLALVRRPAARLLDVPIPPWRALVVLVVRYLPAWILIGTATWCAAQALVPGGASWPDIAAAGAFSWLVGFVVVPAPGGVGVREAAFVAAVALPAGEAAVVAVVARLVFVAVDAGLAAVAVTTGTRR